MGDSFLLRCRASTARATFAGLAPLFVLMFAPSSSSDAVTATVTYTQGTSPTQMDATIKGTGTIIYDSFNGCQASWSHWIVTEKISSGNNPTATTRGVSTSWLSIFVPSLISTDAGTLYCIYVEGNSILTSTIDYSSAFTLSLTTKSHAINKLEQNKKQSLFIYYALLILNASSKFF